MSCASGLFSKSPESVVCPLDSIESVCALLDFMLGPIAKLKAKIMISEMTTRLNIRSEN